MKTQPGISSSSPNMSLTTWTKTCNSINNFLLKKCFRSIQSYGTRGLTGWVENVCNSIDVIPSAFIFIITSLKYIHIYINTHWVINFASLEGLQQFYFLAEMTEEWKGILDPPSACKMEVFWSIIFIEGYPYKQFWVWFFIFNFKYNISNVKN